MQERRMFERIEAPMKIRYEIVETPADAKTTRSKDISGTGIKLALDEKLDSGTALKLSVYMSPQASKVVIFYGEVIWHRKVEVSTDSRFMNYYETGIRFSKADPIIIGKIFKYFAEKNA